MSTLQLKHYSNKRVFLMPYYMEESKLSDQTSQTREAGLSHGTNGEEAPLVWFSGSIQGMIYA